MKILSLFDGMSCGQIAINQLGIRNYEYFASEIDKHAIQVTQKNYPNTFHIGDIKQINYGDLGFVGSKGKTLSWFGGSIDTEIDLLLGGSPCQGFSFAGKQLNFEDPRSALFFEYVRILKEVKPKYFLLENVKMKKEYQDIITEHLFGIEPIEINSALLTAQNRKRLYWVGELQEDGIYKKIEITQLQDRGILLKDILEKNIEDQFFLSDLDIERIEKRKATQKPLKRMLSDQDKSHCLTARGAGEDHSGMILYKNDVEIRKITPKECERLQGVPDNYTDIVSRPQRYKMLGNGWTVPIITHILSHMNFNK